MSGILADKARQRALVVDDEPLIRMLVRETLEREGFLVEEAEDGHRALDLARQSAPDLVLLDVMMPGLDGFAVCRHLTALFNGRSCAILMMTGLDDYQSIQRAFDVGATDFISKPINWQVLGFRVQYIARANQAFKDLQASEAKLKHAQRVARLGRWEWEIAADRFVLSEMIGEILNLPAPGGQPTLNSFLGLVHPLEREYVQYAFDSTVRSGIPFSIDTRLLIADGSERFVHIDAETVADRDHPLRLTGTMQDITERKRSENQILSLAYYDILTGLANRLQFNGSLETAISASSRLGSKLALIFMDLDRFKVVNDTLGHESGDLLLKQVAERLKRCLRRADCVTRDITDDGYNFISRLGGDEFTVLLPHIAENEDVTKVARRIIEEVGKPIELPGHEVVVTISLGISIFPDDAPNATGLIKNADAAMYHAKALGGNTFQFYTCSMNASAMELLAMEGELRHALEHDEFVLFFQPQVDTLTGRMLAAEALIRWQHPEKGLIAPGTFIPLAEESGLITAIDKWVLTKACRQLDLWRGAGITPIRLAINLSGRDFQQNNLLAMVETAVNLYGVDPALLDLELTEGVLMKNAGGTVEVLNALKRMGVQLSIDDFGTGYSSLSYLQRFPVDLLKIDQSFVADVTTNGSNAAIVTAIIALADSLGMNVLAEGVETHEQRVFLQLHGCTFMQGYLFGRPVGAEALAAMIGTDLRPVTESAPGG